MQKIEERRVARENQNLLGELLAVRRVHLETTLKATNADRALMEVQRQRQGNWAVVLEKQKQV